MANRIATPNRRDVVDLVHSACIHLLRRAAEADRASGLSPARLSALSVVVFRGPLTLGELAAAEKVQPPSMTRIVAALEQAGLVRRTPHPTDGRQVIIDLTPAAEELLAAEARAREAWLSGRLQELTAEERAVLREASVIMDKLASG